MKLMTWCESGERNEGENGFILTLSSSMNPSLMHGSCSQMRDERGDVLGSCESVVKLRSRN